VIWALLAFSIIVVVSLVALVFRLSVTVSRTSSNALATLVSFDQRAQQERAMHAEQVKALTDRIMAQDWHDVKAYEAAEDLPDGGFFTPEEQEDDEITQIIPRWGASAARAEAEALAAEDDLDGLEAERSASR